MWKYRAINGNGILTELSKFVLMETNRNGTLKNFLNRNKWQWNSISVRRPHRHNSTGCVTFLGVTWKHGAANGNGSLTELSKIFLMEMNGNGIPFPFLFADHTNRILQAV